MFMFTTQKILGKNHKKMRNKPENKNYLLFSSVFKINFNDPKSNFFLVFDFGRFCVVIRFFIPATTANDLRLKRISIPDLIYYIIFLS